MVFLQGHRLTLNVINPDLLSIEDSYPKWLNSQDGDEFTCHAAWPNDLESIRGYVRNSNGSRNRLLLAIVLIDSNEHIGNLELTRIDFINRKCELAILIGDRSKIGQGFGNEALRLIIGHAFEKLGLHRIYLGVNSLNHRAIKCYTQIGFKNEGVSREGIRSSSGMVDIINMGLLKSEYRL